MRTLYWLHRWSSLLVVLQLLIWLLTGLYFSLVPHDEMMGRKYWQTPQVSSLVVTAGKLCEVEGAATQFALSKIRLRQLAAKAQYVLDTPSGNYYLDAISCEPWQTTAELAKQLALATYNGSGEVIAVTAINNSPEQRGWAGPGFRIDIADDEHTRIYVDSRSGDVLPHRNNTWVVSDWMFRLHFMDYSGGQRFNHWLIWLAAMLALWFAFSGAFLLWQRTRFRRRRHT